MKKTNLTGFVMVMMMGLASLAYGQATVSAPVLERLAESQAVERKKEHADNTKWNIKHNAELVNQVAELRENVALAKEELANSKDIYREAAELKTSLTTLYNDVFGGFGELIRLRDETLTLATSMEDAFHDHAETLGCFMRSMNGFERVKTMQKARYVFQNENEQRGEGFREDGTLRKHAYAGTRDPNNLAKDCNIYFTRLDRLKAQKKRLQYEIDTLDKMRDESLEVSTKVGELVKTIEKESKTNKSAKISMDYAVTILNQVVLFLDDIKKNTTFIASVMAENEMRDLISRTESEEDYVSTVKSVKKNGDFEIRDKSKLELWYEDFKMREANGELGKIPRPRW